MRFFMVSMLEFAIMGEGRAERRLMTMGSLVAGRCALDRALLPAVQVGGCVRHRRGRDVLDNMTFVRAGHAEVVRPVREWIDGRRALVEDIFEFWDAEDVLRWIAVVIEGNAVQLSDGSVVPASEVTVGEAGAAQWEGGVAMGIKPFISADGVPCCDADCGHRQYSPVNDHNQCDLSGAVLVTGEANPCIPAIIEMSKELGRLQSVGGDLSVAFAGLLKDFARWIMPDAVPAQEVKAFAAARGLDISKADTENWMSRLGAAHWESGGSVQANGCAECVHFGLPSVGDDGAHGICICNGARRYGERLYGTEDACGFFVLKTYSGEESAWVPNESGVGAFFDSLGVTSVPAVPVEPAEIYCKDCGHARPNASEVTRDSEPYVCGCPMSDSSGCPLVGSEEPCEHFEARGCIYCVSFRYPLDCNPDRRSICNHAGSRHFGARLYGTEDACDHFVRKAYPVEGGDGDKGS